MVKDPINIIPQYATLIRVKLSTKERLDSLGRKNESYDDVIQKLLNNQKEKHD